MSNTVASSCPPAVPGPALPLTNADLDTAASAGRSLAAWAVSVALTTDYPTLPDAVELSWPDSSEVRWLIWRDAAGVWLDELDTQALTGPGTMAEVLAAAAATLDAEAGQDATARVAA